MKAFDNIRSLETLADVAAANTQMNDYFAGRRLEPTRPQ